MVTGILLTFGLVGYLEFRSGFGEGAIEQALGLGGNFEGSTGLLYFLHIPAATVTLVCMLGLLFTGSRLLKTGGGSMTPTRKKHINMALLCMFSYVVTFFTAPGFWLDQLVVWLGS